MSFDDAYEYDDYVFFSWVSRGAGFLSCLAHHVPTALSDTRIIGK